MRGSVSLIMQRQQQLLACDHWDGGPDNHPTARPTDTDASVIPQGVQPTTSIGLRDPKREEHHVRLSTSR